MQVAECEFAVGDLTLRGKRWGNGVGLPTLALHGWLDNCASFDFLAPNLCNLDIVALDLAGQGMSDHRPHIGAYNIWLDVVEVLSVAKQLGWDTFALLGHSRGAMISTIIAGTFPEKITHLGLVESFVPHVVDPANAPEQLASAVTGLMSVTNKARSLFSSFDEAVKAREKGFLQLSHEDALVLAKRGVVKKEGKYMWNNDIRLNVPSEVKFTKAQIEAFVDRIKIPICVIEADDGLVESFPYMQALAEKTVNVDVVHLPGDHHLHMSAQCRSVAQVLNEYFSPKK